MAKKIPGGACPQTPLGSWCAEDTNPISPPPKFSTLNFCPPLTIFLNESLQMYMHMQILGTVHVHGLNGLAAESKTY